MHGMFHAEDYEKQRDGSLASARVVVPLLLEAFPARSVVDIGCGVGTWLKAFQENGVDDIMGYDGYYVGRDNLCIPYDNFRSIDLRERIQIDRRYDIACSLEVAEHLPRKSAEMLIEALVRAAPVVLFSAGIPGQIGPGHINEQWQDHWAKIFALHNYKPTIFLRSRIWGHEQVCWWYQQNIVVYCNADLYPSSHQIPRSLNVVHPILYSRPMNGRTALRELCRAFWRRLTPSRPPLS